MRYPVSLLPLALALALPANAAVTLLARGSLGTLNDPVLDRVDTVANKPAAGCRGVSGLTERHVEGA